MEMGDGDEGGRRRERMQVLRGACQKGVIGLGNSCFVQNPNLIVL